MTTSPVSSHFTVSTGHEQQGTRGVCGCPVEAGVPGEKAVSGQGWEPMALSQIHPLPAPIPTGAHSQANTRKTKGNHPAGTFPSAEQGSLSLKVNGEEELARLCRS